MMMVYSSQEQGTVNIPKFRSYAYWLYKYEGESPPVLYYASFMLLLSLAFFLSSLIHLNSSSTQIDTVLSACFLLIVFFVQNFGELGKKRDI